MVFNQFSKCFTQLELRYWGCAFGWKVSGAQVFYFAMASWELCALTTFEILTHLTCTLCQQKSYISKGIEPIFENFVSARRCWGWTFAWKVWGAQVFYFCNGKVKTLCNENIWNFAPLNMYTLPARILYLQSYWTIFEIFASTQRCWEWAFGWKV